MLAVRILRSEGYYAGTATSSIEQSADAAGQLRVTVIAVPGERYNFGTIAIQGPDTVPPGLAREALPLDSGKPIVLAAPQSAVGQVFQGIARKVACAISVRNGPEVGKRSSKLTLIR